MHRVALVTLCLALAACRTNAGAAASQQPAQPAARMTPTPQAAALTPARDQSFSIVLEGLGTAGYEWQLQEGYDGRVVRLKGKRYGEPGPLVGASAPEIFEFQALAPGQTTLAFANVRPWEQPGPGREAELRRYTVTVR